MSLLCVMYFDIYLFVKMVFCCCCFCYLCLFAVCVHLFML